eukprot:205099_1
MALLIDLEQKFDHQFEAEESYEPIRPIATLLQRGLHIAGIDHKLGNQLYFNATELRCFDQITQQSLSKAFIEWIFYLLVSLLLWVPILILTFIIHILLIHTSIELRFRISYYIYIVSFLYFTITSIYYNYLKQSLLTSLLPIILSILFQRALVFRFQIREKLILFQQRRLSFLTSNSAIFKCNQKIISFLKLDQALLYFAVNYRVWGITMHHYVPYGQVKLQSHTKYIPFSDVIKALKHNFSKADWNFRQCWKVYNISDKILMCILFFVAISYVIIPYSIIVAQNNMLFGTFDVWISGFIVNAVITYSIITYTEIIFYRLFEYEKYMKHFSKMLEINAVVGNTGRLAIGKDSLFSAPEAPFEEEKKIDYEYDSFGNSKTEYDTRLYLGEKRNGIVWFENWSRVEQLGSLYFNDRKSFVFSVVFCVVFSIGLVIYSVVIDKETININTTTLCIGLLYFTVVFIRLLLVSVRFSDLEHRYIALVQNQHIFGVYDEFEDFKQRKMILMDDIVKQIQFRSVSPTIAGVTLNVALVRLAVSGFIGLVTTAITTLLRSV